MSYDVKCRCGAYAKPELRRRGTNDLCCSRCYDDSWEGHGAEWQALMDRQDYGDDDDGQFAPDQPYEDLYYGDDE